MGEAAVAWNQAATERRACLAQAEHAGLRERHRLRQQAERAAEREGPLRERFEALASPELARIRAPLPEAKSLLAKLQDQSLAHLRFNLAHPEAFNRLDRLDREIAEAAYELDLDRLPLDGIVPAPPRAPGLERDVDLKRGMDLGIGL